ncbi:hypothetical protein BKA62DRAFT_712993 [Auriculariales sp. MPI-PUGE-AT-0066]|nr:hypothetical protein BKA62DRAFT_712993 [Auriculariales sp. MPI-PUGE-AT-0066]
MGKRARIATRALNERDDAGPSTLACADGDETWDMCDDDTRPAKHARPDPDSIEDDFVVVQVPPESPRSTWVRRIKHRANVVARLPSWVVKRSLRAMPDVKENETPGTSLSIVPGTRRDTALATASAPVPDAVHAAASAFVTSLLAATPPSRPALPRRTRPILGIGEKGTGPRQQPSSNFVESAHVAPRWHTQSPSPLGPRPLARPCNILTPVHPRLAHPSSAAAPMSAELRAMMYKRELNPDASPLRYALGRTWWLGHERWWRLVDFGVAKQWMVAIRGVSTYRRHVEEREREKRQRRRQSQRLSLNEQEKENTAGPPDPMVIDADGKTDFTFRRPLRSVENRRVEYMVVRRKIEDEAESVVEY